MLMKMAIVYLIKYEVMLKPFVVHVKYITKTRTAYKWGEEGKRKDGVMRRQELKCIKYS